MSQHHWQHTLAHLAKHTLETETGKNAVKAAAATVVATAPAVATPLAPLVLVGALGYAAYCIFKK